MFDYEEQGRTVRAGSKAFTVCKDGRNANRGGADVQTGSK